MAPCPGMWARSFSLLIFTGVVTSSKLNVPRVLLPYAHTPPSFPLHSESGCYTWSSTRPEVVQVKPDTVGCSTSAVIKALGSSGIKGSAMVMAEDKDTGLLLRADVIVDKIHSLKIVTKTHELYLEETPEKFEVRAYDEHGNEFSTLKGLKFRWTIESGGNAKGTDILRFMTWKDSPYNTEPILEKMEAEGFQGNKVLLEGIKTGSAKVSVKLVDPQHSSVPAAVEPLMVVANLFLLPPAANIIPCASLDYTANQFRGNRLIPVKLPSPNHNLVVPPELGSLDSSLARVVGGGKPSSGVVELVDQNVAPGEVVKTPTADLNVVNPASLELNCLPHNSWTVLANREVTLKVGILDKEGNKVHLSDNLVINLVVDGKVFEITSSLSNGTLHTGIPLVPGQTKITATLVGAGTCKLDTPVSTMATMEILADMALVPRLTVLPWDPVTNTKYSVKHVLTGGDSPLTWVSSNSSICTTSQLGMTTVSGSMLGSSSVIVSMTRASHCQAMAEVQVVEATKLALLESEQEFQVGTSLTLPLDLAFSVSSSFTNCASLPFTSLHSEPSFTSSIVSSDKESCAGVVVDSNLASHSKVTVSWSYPTQAGEVVTLSDSAVVASYSPLVTTNPATGETVLAIDSDRLVAWSGGPQPWPLKPANYFKDLQIGDQTLVTVTPVTHTSLHVYKVTCLAIGDTTLTLTVGNTPSSTLPRPVKVSSTMTIICSKPHTITLFPSIPGPSDSTLPPCPIQAKQGRQAAQAYLDLKILVTIKDAADRVIDSVSSVPVSWTVSEPSLGSVSSPDRLLSQSVEKDELEPGNPYQVLVVTSKTGKVDITATIARDGGLLGAGTHSDTAKIELVNDVIVDPVTVELFELETGSGLSKHGSGFFTLKQDKESLTTNYTPDTRTLAVSPLGTGTTTVSLVDLCLSTKHTATMSVIVSGVASIVLTAKDKVEVGSNIMATVSILDSNKRPLPPSALDHISLMISQDSDFVTIGAQGKSKVGVQAVFPVTGVKLGLVTLTAQASYGGKQVTSLPVQVTVYPPLLLDPRNISLIIGAAFQFTHTGGPADCSVEFIIGDINIASTSTEGIVTSNTLGSTTLTGRAVGKDGSVYSEDTVQVFVRPLSSLQLLVPTKKVLVGSLVPVYLYGQDNDMNVYSYASAMPLLNIDWSVTSPGYKPGLESPLQPAGVGMVAENNGVVIFRAATLGKSSITATVSITSKIEGNGQYQVEKDKTISISTTITVVDRLEILNIEPKAVSGGLLLAPGTSYQLQGNKAAVYSVGSNSVVSTTRKGLVSAGTKLGSAVVTATCTEGDRVEEVAIVVEVRPVQYLLARGAGDQWSGMELENLPRGGNLGLEVSQHDSWGRKFDNNVKELGNRPSRFDLVKLGPGTEGMKTVGKGWTVVRIWDKVSGKEAWLVTRVGEGIKGVTSMNIGDVADFDSTVNSLGEGRWVSEPAGVLDIDSETGVVVAKRSGHARIKYMAGEESVFVRQVLVGKSEGVVLDGDFILSSVEGDKTVGFVLGNNGGTNLLSDKKVKVVPGPGDLYQCEISWDLDTVDITSVWGVSGAWVGGDRWACVFTPLGPGPTVPATVRLAVYGVEHSIKYLPPITVHHTSLEVGIAGGVVRVAGHSTVLDILDTRHSEGLLLGTPWLEEGELHIPVSLAAHHYHSHPTVTVSVPQTGQTVTITILPMVSSCKAPTGFMSAIVGDLMVYYQSVLSIIVAIVLAVYITKTFLGKAPSPKPAPAPAPAQSPSKTGGEQTQEASSPYLWTVDNSPIYGSPIFRRSPPTQPRNMAQYSYN